ncbi:Uncharacterised protein [Mycobacteroides abscessus subsp. abscessus]|nr:Uncharacterised protein [Mycobacteroides abscessus subsp. abscessus]
MVERVSQLVSAVGGIDIDQNRTDLRSGVLHQHPLGAIRSPDTDPVTGRDTQRHEPACNAIDLRIKLTIGPSTVARYIDEGIDIGMSPGYPFEVFPDRFLDDRREGSPGVIGLHRLASPPKTPGRVYG